MRRTFLPLILLIAVACQPTNTPLSDDDVAAIRSLGDAYAQAVLVADADAIAAMYATDATEMPPHLPATQGRDAIRARYETVLGPPMQFTDFTITPIQIEGTDGLAFDRGTWSMAATAEGMPEPIVDTGKYVMVLRRQEDGSWLWTVGIWNSDLPLPTME